MRSLRTHGEQEMVLLSGLRGRNQGNSLGERRKISKNPYETKKTEKIKEFSPEEYRGMQAFMLTVLDSEGNVPIDELAKRRMDLENFQIIIDKF